MEQTAPNTDKHYCLNAQTDIWDHQAAGSNPVTPTIDKSLQDLSIFMFMFFHDFERFLGSLILRCFAFDYFLNICLLEGNFHLF